MKLTDSIVHEWKTRLSRPPMLVALLLFVCAMAYGAINGKLEQLAHLEVIAKHEANVADSMRSWLEDARALHDAERARSVAPWAASPMDVTFASHLPPAPLADFSIGQSDFLPYVGAISLWEPDFRLFSRYEFEDPISLALGSLDLSKVVILILPALLIVLCFDVLSAERDSRRLAHLIAQGAQLRQLVWLRIAIRCGLALSAVFVVAVAALTWNTGPYSIAERLPYFTLWSGAVTLYAAFWVGLIALVVSGNRPGSANIVLLVLVWAGLTLVLPASLAALSQAIYPTPSRAAYLAEARELEIETELEQDEATRRFVGDHPDIAIDDSSQVPAYLRTAFLATSTVDQATRPALAAFEEAAANREEALVVLRYVSPAVVAHGLFNSVAGTAAARHRGYAAQARTFKAGYAQSAGPYVVAGKRLPLADTESLPQFRFQGESLGALAGRNAVGLVFLALLTAALAMGSDRRLRRTSARDAVLE